MAEGDADPETGATGDADPNETGATDDAGPTDSGDSEQDDVVPQRVYDKAYAEARDTFKTELKERDQQIDQLKSELEELKGDEDGRKAPEERSDVYTEEQVEELKSTFREKVEQREEAVRSANQAHARTRLAEELRDQGVVKPEMFADLLVEKGRVQADVTEGFDQFEVLTSEGTKMIDESGDEATVDYFAEKWAAQNPELVRSRTREGADYGGSEGDTSGPSTNKDLSDLSVAERRELLEEHDYDHEAALEAIGA